MFDRIYIIYKVKEVKIRSDGQALEASPKSEVYNIVTHSTL